MNLLWMALAGLIIGAIAKFIVPGKEPGGMFVTMLLGIVGTFLGNFTRSIFNSDSGGGLSFNYLSPMDWIFSIAGAVLVIIIWKKFIGPMLEKK